MYLAARLGCELSEGRTGSKSAFSIGALNAGMVAMRKTANIKHFLVPDAMLKIKAFPTQFLIKAHYYFHFIDKEAQVRYFAQDHTISQVYRAY